MCGKFEVTKKSQYLLLYLHINNLNKFFLCSRMPAKNKEKLLHSLDADGDGKIDLEEFRQLFKK